MLQLQKNVEFLDKAKIACLDLGERLKLVRIMLRKSQESFGKSLHRSQTTISAYELNRVKPNKDFINLCAENYNISPTYLTQGIEPMFLKEQTPLVTIEVVDKKQNTLKDKSKDKVSQILNDTTKQTPSIQAIQDESKGKAKQVSKPINANKDKDKAKQTPPRKPLNDESNSAHILSRTQPSNETALQQEQHKNSSQIVCQGHKSNSYSYNDDELNSALTPQQSINLHKALPITQSPSYNVYKFKDIELDIIVYESKIYFSFANISKIIGYALISDIMLCVKTFSQDELKQARFRTFKELDTYYKDEVYVEYKGFLACYKGHKNKDIIAFMEFAKSIEPNLKPYFTQSAMLNGEYNISIFEKVELGKIRVKGDSEKPLFCLSDVCGILGLESVNKVANAIKAEFGLGELNSPNNLDLIYPIIDNLGREKQARFITEPQLYFVLMRSDKPKAKPFRQWVINEVLPSIRKSGKYEMSNHSSNANPTTLTTQSKQRNYDKALDLALAQVNEHQKLIEHNQSLMLENQRYKGLFKRDGEFTLMEVAKLFEISTFELKNFLIKENLITHYAKSNKQYPTQYAKDNGFVKMKLTDTKRVSYDIYLTMPLIERLKEFFGV